MIMAAMQEFDGNKTRAALALGVSRRNLIRLVQKYQLE
jgi:DNA-binding protein Fis